LKRQELVVERQRLGSRTSRHQLCPQDQKHWCLLQPHLHHPQRILPLLLFQQQRRCRRRFVHINSTYLHSRPHSRQRQTLPQIRRHSLHSHQRRPLPNRLRYRLCRRRLQNGLGEFHERLYRSLLFYWRMCGCEYEWNCLLYEEQVEECVEEFWCQWCEEDFGV